MLNSQLSTVEGAVFTPFRPPRPSTRTPIEQELLTALAAQADFIQEIVARNETLFANLTFMKKELALLQAQRVEGQEASEEPSRETILGLVGTEGRTYTWGLELDGKLPEPLCKGKYFQFKVKLVPLQETLFPVEERVQISMAIYSTEKTPKPIQFTMTGHPLVKGYPESMLSYSPADKCHVAYFKIQICEVSSHFRNGWVFLVVQPKYTGSAEDSLMTQVKPMVLEKVVIRAKEMAVKRLKQRNEELA